MQGDTFFSLSDHSSWSSNEQLDLEADKTSFELDSEVSSLALGRESHESSKNATVRKKQRKRSEQVGPNKHSINSLDTKGLQDLQWEYSKDDLALYDNVEKQPNPVLLETIYQSIMEHREESKSESRRTQLACRKMQIQIRRVANTCSEFTTRMEEVETRISHPEDEAGSHQVTREAMEKQLEDTQWKLTDLEDRLRRNNLRVLGVPKGLEGADTHGFMVALFKEAFPDLHQWDWDREIQRAHRFPFSKVGSNSEGGSGRPRAILISLLNYRARQTIYDRARPNSRRMLEIPVVEAVKSGTKIGKIYTLLTELQSDDMVHQNEQWTVRFGLAGEWMDQSLAMADTTLLSANLKTQHYKTMMDLYYTPAKLKKGGNPLEFVLDVGKLKLR
ncbi:hypothetical protein NDU88_011526 [Pleurodeles waltl]|uniref:Uncharacterized protein n=1 Tax=Pleurodeles waltl TaxID=8319 RepID=A0AAV7PZ40_PLEWA|nr:hypothetical protein NDU88_011526 [Pleurodeles waltl]